VNMTPKSFTPLIPKAFTKKPSSLTPQSPLWQSKRMSLFKQN